jgi:4-amino-4-deoxy-L-arabinose transferase-like glycosyltransferase
MRESVARFTTTEFHRTAPFYYYAPIIASTFFAWSFLLPESVVIAWRNRKDWSRADRLFIIWTIVVVLFFSVSQSKLPGYILTGVMALGVLTARIFALALQNTTGREAKIVWHATIPLLLLSIIAAVLLVIISFNPELLKSRLSLKPELFDLFMPTILPVALSFGVVAVLSVYALWKQNTKLIFAAFISFPVLLMTVNFDVLSLYAESRSARTLAKSIPTTLSTDTELVCMECLPNGLPFYLKRLVTVLSNTGNELTSNYVIFTLNSGKPWPEGIVPVTQSKNWLATRKHPIYLIADKNHLSMLQSIAAERGVEVNDLDSKYSAVLIPTPAGN